jgi:hypothetical protein
MCSVLEISKVFGRIGDLPEGGPYGEEEFEYACRLQCLALFQALGELQ